MYKVTRHQILEIWMSPFLIYNKERKWTAAKGIRQRLIFFLSCSLFGMSFFSSHSLSGSSNPQEISTKGHVLNQTLILIFAVILLSSGWEYFLSKKKTPFKSTEKICTNEIMVWLPTTWPKTIWNHNAPINNFSLDKPALLFRIIYKAFACTTFIQCLGSVVMDICW